MNAIREPYKVRGRKNRGKALLATRDIQRGELIICEAPLLRLPPIPEDLVHHGHFLTANRLHNCEKTVTAAIMKMSASQKDDFGNLHPDGATDLSKIATNAFTHEIDDERDFAISVACVYKTISRVNHSCQPNAELSWRKDEQQGMLHAIHPIANNTEITIDYMNNPQDCLRASAHRINDLQPHYGFACRCVACFHNGGVNGANDNLRILALREYNSIFWSIDTSEDAPDDEDEARRVAQTGHLTTYIDTLKQLELKDWKLAEAYQARAKLHELGLSLCQEGIDQSNGQGQAPSQNDHARHAAEDWKRAFWMHVRCWGETHEEVKYDRDNMLRMELVAARLGSPTIPQGFP